MAYQVIRDRLGSCKTQMYVPTLVTRRIRVSGYLYRRIATGVGERDDALQNRYRRTAKSRCGFIEFHGTGAVVGERSCAQGGNICSAL